MLNFILKLITKIANLAGKDGEKEVNIPCNVHSAIATQHPVHCQYKGRARICVFVRQKGGRRGALVLARQSSPAWGWRCFFISQLAVRGWTRD
jgi:hypothetical protein